MQNPLNFNGNMFILKLTFIIFITQNLFTPSNLKKHDVQVKLTKENCEGNRNYVMNFTEFNVFFGKNGKVYVNYFIEVTEDIEENATIFVSVVSFLLAKKNFFGDILF